MAKTTPRRRAKQLKNRRSKIRNRQIASAPAHPDIAAALTLQQSGKLEQAKQLYCQILEREPDHADAWHFLGMTFYSANQFSMALDCLRKAQKILPDQPHLLANLGLVYRGLGDLSQAESVLKQALSLDAESSNIRINLGTVLLEQQKLDAAAEQFECVLAADPTEENAAMNLGNLREAQGRFQDAESLYRAILQRNPRHPLVLNNLGETLRNQGNWTAAADVLIQAIELQPDSLESRVNLGRTLVNLHRNDEARMLFSQLIAQFPDNPKAYHYLGRACFDAGDMLGAREHIERALEFDPHDAYAHCSLGFLFLEIGQTENAERSFRTALEHHAELSSAHSSLLFVMSGNAELDQQALFREHQNWGQRYGTLLKGSFEGHSNDRTTGRRLRIGYVSPDLRRHAVAAFFRPVLAAHQSANVETYCYAEVAVPDDMTRTLQGLAHHWRSTVGLSDEQVAQQVRNDEIDILVDLAGHTAKNRLQAFAFRPAPVQVTWLGYPNTTGLSAIDYRLTCEIQNPVEEPSYHVEQLVRMKAGSFCFTAPALAPEIAPPPALENGYITFGSLHRPFKISAEARQLWASVLQANPDSRLILFNTRFTKETATELRSDLERLGIGDERIEIRHEITGETYLTNYNDIDIGLDVTPWAGGTTTLEALWMGVPVVAYFGARRSSRSTAAIMNQVNLAELIAHSDAEYVKLAAELADNLPKLEALRWQLRETLEQTICDGQRFTHELEQEYRKMWTLWCEKTESVSGLSNGEK